MVGEIRDRLEARGHERAVHIYLIEVENIVNKHISFYVYNPTPIQYNIWRRG